MRAGLLDRSVELQTKPTPTDGDPTGGTWTTQATVWAEDMEARAVRRFIGDQFIAEATKAYRIRYRTDVNPTWRLKDGDELWTIVGANEGAGRRTETILQVKRFDPNDET